MRVDRRWLRPGVLLVTLLVALVLTLPITLTPGLRTRLTEALSERFDSTVELETLRVSVLPRLRVAGGGVVLRHKGRIDVPPLITVASFSADATLFGLIRRPLHLGRVHLEGLEINVPPGSMDIDSDEEPGDGSKTAARSGESADEAEQAPPAEQEPPPPAKESPLVVGDLLSERAVLRLLRETGKDARVFEIHHLSMQDTGSHKPWTYRATLTNPTPPGEIATGGTFGPWNASRPALTPLNAEYEFRDADLGVFKGIRGTLHSTGAFKGVLERIEIEGRADVPDFALDDVGQPVPLETRFRAIVDGTSGNTWLKPVDAMLLQSGILADGGVVERKGEDGRTVRLDIVMNDARIEDVLRLAVKAEEPPMTGGLKLKTKFVLPPGKRDVIEKLQLDGRFEIATARFTQGSVQARVNELSQKAQGERDEPPDNVVSDFSGQFVMRNGVIRFSNVSFAVPGARVDVSGQYTLRSEALDFRGTVRLDAKLSELTTGVKSFFLKLIDPLVRRRNVTVIPITIDGTVDDPKFGLDIRRAFTPK